MIQQKVDAVPRTIKNELKEKNPQILQQVSVRTIQSHRKIEIGYEHRAPKR